MPAKGGIASIMNVQKLSTDRRLKLRVSRNNYGAVSVEKKVDFYDKTGKNLPSTKVLSDADL